MSSGSRPIWLQIVAALLLIIFANTVGFTIGSAVLRHPTSVIGVWAGALPAPTTMLLTIGLWRLGKRSAWWILTGSVLVFLGIGLLAWAIFHALWPSAIPNSNQGWLVPLSGLVWGGLLHQAASQSYLPFLGQDPSAK